MSNKIEKVFAKSINLIPVVQSKGLFLLFFTFAIESLIGFLIIQKKKWGRQGRRCPGDFSQICFSRCGLVQAENVLHLARVFRSQQLQLQPVLSNCLYISRS